MDMKHTIISMSVLILFCGVSDVRADELTPLDRFWIGAGTYNSNNDLDIRIDGEDNQAGSEVNFQRDFGFAEKERAATFYAGFTLADRHQFSFSRHLYTSSSSGVLEADLDIDDQDFVVDAAFGGDLDIDITSVAYTYFFYSNERGAFGIGVGGVRYGIEASLLATGTIDDGDGGIETIVGDVHKDESAWAPVLRAQYSQMIDEKWRFNIEIAGARKSNGSVQGESLNGSVSVDYFPWKHLGLSLRYNYNDVDLDYAKSSYHGRLNLQSQGPSLLAIVRF